jgi:two-component system, OmpR family, response regulator MprA
MNHILVVDDDPGVRGMLALALESEGYQVETASNGVEALEDIERSEPAAMLLDIHMPKLDGPGVARHLRERGPHPPFVVMTDLFDAQEWCRKLEADACLPKPFDLDRLFNTIDRLVAG